MQIRWNHSKKLQQELIQETHRPHKAGRVSMCRVQPQRYLLHGFEQRLSVVLESHDELQLGASWFHGWKKSNQDVRSAFEASSNTHTHTDGHEHTTKERHTRADVLLFTNLENAILHECIIEPSHLLTNLSDAVRRWVWLWAWSVMKSICCKRGLAVGLMKFETMGLLVVQRVRENVWVFTWNTPREEKLLQCKIKLQFPLLYNLLHPKKCRPTYNTKFQSFSLKNHKVKAHQWDLIWKIQVSGFRKCHDFICG